MMLLFPFSLPQQQRHDRRARHEKRGHPCELDRGLVWLGSSPITCLGTRTAPHPEIDRHLFRHRIASVSKLFLGARSEMSTCGPEMFGARCGSRICIFAIQLIQYQHLFELQATRLVLQATCIVFLKTYKPISVKLSLRRSRRGRRSSSPMFLPVKGDQGAKEALSSSHIFAVPHN